MCVREGEDRTAPKVVATEPGSGEAVGINVTNKNISIITNELSSCRWDLSDIDYSEMGNFLECGDSLMNPSSSLGYVCSGNLPIGNASQDYYVKCMDQPWLNNSGERNANAESFVFSIEKASSALSINKIKPDSYIEIASDLTTVELKVATSGGMDYHFCSYSFSGYDSMIEMFETGNERTHVQVLNRAPGDQKIYVECHDETGDFARDFTEFEIARDSSSPQVARIWQSGGFVNLILSDYGECRFSFDSCNFVWDQGFDVGSGEKLRFAVVRGEKYHIKCKDDFGNMPSGCSVAVQAS
jgi:hypothetical protein